jgi:hypothetical protein
MAAEHPHRQDGSAVYLIKKKNRSEYGLLVGRFIADISRGDH